MFGIFRVWCCEHMLLNKCRAIFHWLTEAKYLWCASVVVLVACLIALRPGAQEPVIRLTGLVLQILGIGTVAWGISETRALYGNQSIYSVFMLWIKRFPLLKRPANAKAAMSGLGTTASSARAYGIIGAVAGASLEQRIEALEKNLPLVHARITAAEQEGAANMQKITVMLTTESQ